MYWSFLRLLRPAALLGARATPRGRGGEPRTSAQQATEKIGLVEKREMRLLGVPPKTDSGNGMRCARVWGDRREALEVPGVDGPGFALRRRSRGVGRGRFCRRVVRKHRLQVFFGVQNDW